MKEIYKVDCAITPVYLPAVHPAISLSQTRFEKVKKQGAIIVNLCLYK